MSKDSNIAHDIPQNNVKAATAKDLSQATSLAEVKTTLAELRSRHDAVTARLDASLAQHEDLLRQLRRLDLSRARLGTLANSARAISHGMLSGAASTAGRISDAVERLDLEQARVKATLDVVEQVTELKQCVLGVVGSMGAPQDWETAAEYISRASRIPESVARSGFAEAVVPTSEVPDPPSVTLHEAAQSLCQLFSREFDKAVDEGDSAKITRFFKMFPLIQRSREGLDAYGRYVCQGVALRARARLQAARGSAAAIEQGRVGFVYANALTKLFEHIAQVIDGHSPLVERHYGAGTMLQVMQRVHNEADVQGGIVLDTWYDERTIERKLTDVKSYAYSFLVQSFMSAQKVPAAASRPQSTVGGASANKDHEEDELDTKGIDQVLSEIVAMLSSWSLYVVFISSRSVPNDDTDEAQATKETLKAPDFLSTSNLPKKVSKVLTEPFKTFSTFFLRRSVERAFQLDESPTGLSLILSHPIAANPPFITSSVDDIMYVVNQMLQRALATSQAEIVASTCATIARVLGSDFIGMIQRKMRDESYPKAAIQGALPPEDKVIAFIVLINNLDVATDYIRRIVHAHLDTEVSVNPAAQPADTNASAPSGKRSLADLFPMGRDAHAVRSALKSLENSFVAKARELLNDGIAVLFGQVLKARVRPALTDAFRDTDYSADVHADGTGDGKKDGAADDEYVDGDLDGGSARASAVKSRWQHGWDILSRPMKRILTAHAYERLLLTTVSFVAGMLERRVWSYHGRVGQLGAVALERDVVDIVNVTVRGESFKLREQFARCIEIVTVMNLEEEEWEEQAEEGAGGEWVLSEEERVRARGMVGSGDER